MPVRSCKCLHTLYLLRVLEMDKINYQCACCGDKNQERGIELVYFLLTSKPVDDTTITTSRQIFILQDNKVFLKDLKFKFNLLRYSTIQVRPGFTKYEADRIACID